MFILVCKVYFKTKNELIYLIRETAKDDEKHCIYMTSVNVCLSSIESAMTLKINEILQ